MNTQKSLSDTEAQVLMLQAEIEGINGDHKVVVDELQMEHNQEKLNLVSDHNTQLANLTREYEER